jgi:hypothetical protein
MTPDREDIARLADLLDCLSEETPHPLPSRFWEVAAGDAWTEREAEHLRVCTTCRAADAEIRAAVPPPALEKARGQEFMLALLDHAMNLIRTALRAGTRNAATQLYRGNEDDSLATKGALLSAWETFVQDLDQGGPLPDAVGMPELAARFVRRAYNRMRRQQYRERRMQEELSAGRGRDAEGELLTFDPPDVAGQAEILKILPLEIAEVLGEQPERERRVLELWLQEHTYAEIVRQVKEELPGTAISQPMVSRIVNRFTDEMRGRLE